MKDLPTQQARLWHRQRLRFESHDYAEEGYVYFVTISARHGTSPFTLSDLARSVVQALHFQRETGRARIYSFCLMPDHLHLALSPCGGWSIPQVIQSFKSYTTKTAWRCGLHGELWHRSFFDHIARRDEDLLAICEYILANPVRRGLVADVAAWPYSGMPDTLPL